MRTTRLFDGVERKTVQTSAGDCDMPILYRDGSMLTLGYRVDAARAAELVAGPFEPWVVMGKAIALFCAFEYRDTSIGPYGEIGVGLLIKRKGTSPSLLAALADLRRVEAAGLFVVNLPVTTQEAFAAGSELWGYPKYVASIDTKFEEDHVHVALGDELEVSIGHRGMLRTPGFPLVLYSTLGDRILRTIVDVDFKVDWGGASSTKITLKNEGPTSKTLAHLGMDALKPSFAFRTNEFCSLLPLGKEMGTYKPIDRAVGYREAAE